MAGGVRGGQGKRQGTGMQGDGQGGGGGGEEEDEEDEWWQTENTHNLSQWFGEKQKVSENRKGFQFGFQNSIFLRG